MEGCRINLYKFEYGDTVGDPVFQLTIKFYSPTIGISDEVMLDKILGDINPIKAGFYKLSDLLDYRSKYYKDIHSQTDSIIELERMRDESNTYKVSQLLSKEVLDQEMIRFNMFHIFDYLDGLVGSMRFISNYVLEIRNYDKVCVEFDKF